MAKITSDMKELFEKNICAVATADKDGVPNVVPIGFARVHDDETILIANIFMKKTERNLRENPRLALSIWDEETLCGYQFKGRVEIVDSGSIYKDVVKWVKSKRPTLTPKSAILVRIEEIYDLKPGSSAGRWIA